ncbi:hypothetical protein K1T71_007908 [Dendrolimus kikuchii]|uniref:Uncharacterized protein n=1 Tax=Dendrolimus kikuchii TaxID=765133 RepID=A0ACC1CYC3_9NEOP|nr:hypothetical protein K1T71_007908 [Dendrolimus kikuchii]
MHPPYSPDIAPSDFHLFRSLQNSLGSVRLTSREDCQNHLSQFFDQKPQNFYSNGITIPCKLSYTYVSQYLTKDHYVCNFVHKVNKNNIKGLLGRRLIKQTDCISSVKLYVPRGRAA